MARKYRRRVPFAETPDAVYKIRRMLKGGNKKTSACKMAGLSMATYDKWDAILPEDEHLSVLQARQAAELQTQRKEIVKLKDEKKKLMEYIKSKYVQSELDVLRLLFQMEGGVGHED